MAILQLSRLTNRSGLQENLPQLSGAELGWSIDSRKLFIGNGQIVDGAPQLGNTEILTEFSDILSLSSSYTYKGLAGGYQVDSGGNGNVILRSLISKLDDIASAKDFGAIGDGITDDTAAINRALYELFIRGDNASTRRGLLFPAGRYLISDTIRIPPHAKIIGEGIGSSVFVFTRKHIAALVGITDELSPGVYTLNEVPDNSHTLTLLVDGVEKEREVDFTIAGTSLTFITTAPVAGNAIEVYTIAPNVMTTSDSNHDILADIGTSSGSILPTGIEISSIGITSLENNTLLLINSTTDTSLTSVSLIGPQVNTSTTSGTIDLDTAAIEIVSLGGARTENITFTKMLTSGTTYAMRIKDKAKGIVLESSRITNHFLGIILDRKSNVDTNPAYLDYPTGIIITHNIFDIVAREALLVEEMVDLNVMIVSTHNMFYNVGNDTGSTPITPVIYFKNPKCTSIGDLFERTDEYNLDVARILLPHGIGGIAFDNSKSIKLGSYEREVGLETVFKSPSIPVADIEIGEIYKILAVGDTDFTLIGSASNQIGTVFTATAIGIGSGTVLINEYIVDIFTMESIISNSYKIDYTIRRGTDTRFGTITTSVNGAATTYNDEYTDTSNLEVMLKIVPGLDGNSSFTATTAHSGQIIMNFSIVRLD